MHGKNVPTLPNLLYQKVDKCWKLKLIYSSKADSWCFNDSLCSDSLHTPPKP